MHNMAINHWKDKNSYMNNTLQYYETKAIELCERYETARLKVPHELLAAAFPPNVRILELGFGSGRDAEFLLKRGFDWWGIEISAAMATQALRLHPELRGRITRSDLCRPLPFTDRSFDGAFAFAVMMHLNMDVVSDVLSYVYRVLNDTAPFVISVPLGRTDVDDKGLTEDGRYFLPWSQSQWSAAIAKAGYTIENCLQNSDGLGRDITWLSLIARKGIGKPEP